MPQTASSFSCKPGRPETLSSTSLLPQLRTTASNSNQSEAANPPGPIPRRYPRTGSAAAGPVFGAQHGHAGSGTDPARPEGTWWHDSDGNPSVSSSCSGMKIGFSYCAEAPAGPPGGGSSRSTTIAATNPGGPSTTKPPGNGIQTPRPVQEGVVGGSPVTTLDPTTTNPGNGINTPTPAQDGHGRQLQQAYVCVGVVVGGGGGSPVTTPGPTTTKPGNGHHGPYAHATRHGRQQQQVLLCGRGGSS
ncbi:hypothetical protein MAPG_07261 [Magnaporthiopsis poae ATCC 64411]|uniref:Uncharacterized protein n=1 Tax=Magnaporthiopsis poae (strain ATCC 64411 / 73-15) TaxID=644358 RepID=A0A0C4E472_MAGP6|nr:hypothetical protein MAPG_07261 [Magnaporthiopsis poae ATCC 64411]